MPHATQTMSDQLALTLFHDRAAASKSDVLGADAPGALRDCAASPSALRFSPRASFISPHCFLHRTVPHPSAQCTLKVFFYAGIVGSAFPEFLSISCRKDPCILWNTDPIVPA